MYFRGLKSKLFSDASKVKWGGYTNQIDSWVMVLSRIERTPRNVFRVWLRGYSLYLFTSSQDSEVFFDRVFFIRDIRHNFDFFLTSVVCFTRIVHINLKSKIMDKRWKFYWKVIISLNKVFSLLKYLFHIRSGYYNLVYRSFIWKKGKVFYLR